MRFTEKINKGRIWDKKSLTIIFIIIMLLIGITLFVTVDFEGPFIRNSLNWAATVGRIDSIEELTGINQTRMGNKISITGYRVKYTYLVEAKEYHTTAILSSSKSEFISFISETKNEWGIEVYYKKGAVTKSYINSNLKSVFYEKSQ